MKKVLILVLLGFSVLHIFAQSYEGVIPGSNNYYLPRIFTSDNISKFVNFNELSNNKCQFTIYNEKFEIEKQIEYENNCAFINLIDVDECMFNTAAYYKDAKITQTLFNDDEKYEIVTFELDNEDARWLKKYKIVSEDGNIIKNIEPENGCKFSSYPEIYLVKINDIFYLAIKASVPKGDDSYERIVLYYRIDKSTSSIQLVAKLPLNVSPTIASQSDIITVELGENSNAKEIEIINASGQLVKRVPVTPGQKSVSFNAQGITRGVNMVHAPGENNNATKIIIK